jgi:tRNA U34 5-methylaminomethyl-2-thiouridine-forming methyltransferase MnmC
MMIEKPVLTQDGSFTYYSPHYGECYHSTVGAVKESLEKFIEPSNVLYYKNPRVLDIGFGLGYNALLTLKLCCQVHIVSLEKEPEVLLLANNVHKEPFYKEVLKALKKRGVYKQEEKMLSLFMGEALLKVREQLYNNRNNFFSHIFLDAFSPRVNPELWTLEFFRDLFKLLKEDGALVTYSSALPVMAGLLKAGFFLDYTRPVGRKRGGIIAYKNSSLVKEGLSRKDLFLINNSVHAVPNYYRQGWNVQKVIDYRQKLIENCLKWEVRLSHKKALKKFQTLYENEQKENC